MVAATSADVCAVAEADGSRRWCIAPGASPRFAGHEFAYRAAGGAIVAVSASSGLAAWSLAPPRGIAPDRAQRVFSFGSSFVVLTPNVAPRDTSNLTEIDQRGEKIWSSEVAVAGEPGASPIHDRRYFILGSDAATEEQAVQYVFRIGDRDQKPVVVSNASAVLAVRGQTGTFISSQSTTPEAAASSIGLFDADLQTGRASAVVTYSPEDITASTAENDPSEDATAPPKATVSQDGTVYISWSGRVYAYDRPLQQSRLGSTSGELIDVSNNGEILVDRGSGLWLVDIANGEEHDRLLLDMQSPIVEHVWSGPDLYTLLADGTLYALSTGGRANAGRKAHGCVGELLATSRSKVLKVCSDEAGTTIEAYDK